MQIKFLGAAGMVTGSCYVLTSDTGQSVMIDCGMFQGSAQLEKLNFNRLDFDCSMISGAVLTHAHLDHCGRLPTLLPQNFSGNIWMTPPTRDLTELSLLDSAKIGKEDNKALYDKELVLKTVEKFKTVEYEKEFIIGDFQIIMRDAGHILGSASLEIIDQSVKEGANRIVFSGDLGNSPEDLIRATEQVSASDFVVMESTYGDRIHPENDPSETIQKEIATIEITGGTLLIPAFSIERSQELLHRISHLKKSGKIKSETEVYFDSPMGEKATMIFEKYRQYYNEELKRDFVSADPFHFPGLKVVENREDGRELAANQGPKVIISGSGMMTGGRILNHAARCLPDSSTRLLIVGYQGEGTLGRAILEGKREVRIDGNPVFVRAAVNQTQAMSSHADQPRLLAWLKTIQQVKKVFLTHGENASREILAEKIKTDLGMTNIAMPVLNQNIVIDRISL